MSGSLLVKITGPDRPGVAAQVFATLDAHHLVPLDVEQIQVHGQLLLCVEVVAAETAGAEPEEPGTAPQLAAALGKALRRALPPGAADLDVVVEPLTAGPTAPPGPGRRAQLVTVLAPRLGAEALAGVFSEIADAGGNVDRIVRLSSYPVVSYELVVSGADGPALRRRLAVAATRLSVDVAVQRAGLHRRAKHLIVLDADSTLLQGEVIDLLAERVGHAGQVAALTAAAMAGELDFHQALAQRVGLLRGLPIEVLGQVAAEVRLAPGARTLVRTLRRLGYVTAVVSGGFVQVVAPVAAQLGIDHLAANVLEVGDGHLTGRLVGPVIDRAGKAAALADFAAAAGVPLAQTVAVGDGANDLDMLAMAGLGIAFNAKPIVQDAADAALNVPYLDAILFLLGISRDEVEAADQELELDEDPSGGPPPG